MTEQTWIDPQVDRSEWGAGAWDDEPDKVQWTDETTGMVCLTKRHPKSGNWCGYVGVAPGHPWYGKGYGDPIGECNSYCEPSESGYHFGHQIDSKLEVHGGITFTDFCQEGPPEQAICHIPEPGSPDNLWWFGFDCNHGWDLAPGSAAFFRKHGMDFRSHDKVYHALPYVKSECASLARQLKAVV